MKVNIHSKRSTFPKGIGLSGGISGTGNIIFDGGRNTNPIIALSGTGSTYTGTTTISTDSASNSLTVQAGIANALPTGTVLTIDGAASTSSAVTAYDLNGSNQTIAGLSAPVFVNRLNQIQNSAGTASTLTINNTADYSFGGQITGTNLSLTKTGSGTQTLTGANTYSGATTVNAGKLVVNGNQPLATGATTVAAGSTTGNPVATLAGNGGIGGSLSLAAESASGFKNDGVLAPTASASGTALDVAGTTTFGTGSIFEWNLVTANGSDPGANTSNQGSYGQLAGAEAITGSDAIFKILLTGNTFADNFWDTNKSWNKVFSGAGATTALDSLFTTFDPSSGLTSNGTAPGRGQFTFNGSTSTLSWSAVPEPSTALAGLLLGASLLRRRRN